MSIPSGSPIFNRDSFLNTNFGSPIKPAKSDGDSDVNTSISWDQDDTGSPIKKTDPDYSFDENSFSWDNDASRSSSKSPIKKQLVNKALFSSTSVDSSYSTESGSAYNSPIKPLAERSLNSFTARMSLNKLFDEVANSPLAEKENEKAITIAKKKPDDLLHLTGNDILKVKFSQASISCQSDETPLESIISSMNEKGWNSNLSKYINCVQTPIGELVSLDNRRLYCSKQVVSLHDNYLFKMPVRICKTPNDCTAVANTIFFQIEKNKNILFSKLLLTKMYLLDNFHSTKEGSQNIISTIANALQKLNKKIIFPKQIDDKLEKIDVENQGDTPLWCIYARMRVLNTDVDDKLLGFDKTRVINQ